MFWSEPQGRNFNPNRLIDLITVTDIFDFGRNIPNDFVHLWAGMIWGKGLILGTTIKICRYN